MEKIYERSAIENALKKSRLPDRFNTENLEFFVIRYQMGEFLSTPGQPIEYFQFLVRGNAALYYLDENGVRRNVTILDGYGLLGDMEFALGNTPIFYTEALSPVTVIALPMEANRPVLEKDCRFLMYLLRQASLVKIFSSRNAVVLPHLKERLLYHLQKECPGKRLTGMERTAARLQCSRRQLQRVVRQLEEEGRLVKLQKGCYQLTDHTAACE